MPSGLPRMNRLSSGLLSLSDSGNLDNRTSSKRERERKLKANSSTASQRITGAKLPVKPFQEAQVGSGGVREWNPDGASQQEIKTACGEPHAIYHS